MFGKFAANKDVVEAKGNIPYWVIGQRLGVHENTVRHWMRNEMVPKKKAEVLKAIEEIKQELLQEVN